MAAIRLLLIPILLLGVTGCQNKWQVSDEELDTIVSDILEAPKEQSSIDFFIGGMRSGNSKKFMERVKYLTEIEPITEEAVKLVKKRLTTDNWDSRPAAKLLQTLIRIHPNQFDHEIRECLKAAPPSDVTWMVLAALGELGTDAERFELDVIALLEKTIDFPSGVTRDYCANTLLGIGSERALNHLAKYSESEYRILSKAANKALQKSEVE